MMMKTVGAFRDRTIYTRSEDGSWKAEFHGAVNVIVEGPSLERCRFAALDALDERICEWILADTDAARGSQSSS